MQFKNKIPSSFLNQCLREVKINISLIFSNSLSFIFIFFLHYICTPWGHKELDTTERLHFLSFYSSFWRRKWQPTPAFLPGESQGWMGLVGCSLWGCRESDTTGQLTHTFVVVQLLSYVRLCDHMDYRPPDFSVHGISQARVLEWATVYFSKGSSRPRDRTHASCTVGKFFTAEPPRKPLHYIQVK